MGVLGEGSSEAETKAAARRLAGQSNVAAGVFAVAAVTANLASDGASQALALASAAAWLWSAVKARIADDPPRQDYERYVGQLPREVVRRAMSAGTDTESWTTRTLAQAYLEQAALTSAERLAGARETTRGRGSSWVAVQATLARENLRLAREIQDSRPTQKMSVSRAAVVDEMMAVGSPMERVLGENDARALEQYRDEIVPSVLPALLARLGVSSQDQALLPGYFEAVPIDDRQLARGRERRAMAPLDPTRTGSWQRDYTLSTRSRIGDQPN